MKIIQETIQVPGFPNSQALFTGYLCSNYECIDADRLHPAVLILPGGGYEKVSDRECEPVALQFAARGISAFTLKYSVAPDTYPQALYEALTAFYRIRSHATQYHIQPDNISVCGFSAGGHLALCTAVFWKEKEIQNLLGDPKSLLRPDKLILSYPVVSSGTYGHKPSFANLLGKDAADSQLLERLSIEKQITEDFPPVYLWHTYTDKTVPVQNSLLLAMALAEKGVPLEMHIYPEGKHGLSLATYMTSQEIPYEQPYACSAWLNPAVDFIYKTDFPGSSL